MPCWSKAKDLFSALFDKNAITAITTIRRTINPSAHESLTLFSEANLNNLVQNVINSSGASRSLFRDRDILFCAIIPPVI
jgi:hypothetical protein